MEWVPETKAARLLAIYFRLADGEVLNKDAAAEAYRVSPRSIQRDIEILRWFLAQKKPSQKIVSDRAAQGYRLEDSSASGPE